jgi:hypothetical protein
MFLHERQVEFVLGNLARMAKRSVRGLEVRRDVTRAFNALLYKRMEKRVRNHYRVHNYAFSESGRDVIGWTEGMSMYWLLMRTLRPLACHVVDRTGRPMVDHVTRSGVDISAKGPPNLELSPSS